MKRLKALGFLAVILLLLTQLYAVTPIWITGFEHGLAVPATSGLGLYDTAAGTLAIQSSVKRSGDYALQIYPLTSLVSNVGKKFTSAVYVGSVYIRFAAWPSADASIVQGETPTEGFSIYVDVTAHRFFPAISSLTAGSVEGPTLALNTWYRLDCKFNPAANPWLLDWAVDGTPMTQYSGALAATTMYQLHLGFTAARTGNLFFDDLVLSTTAGDYPIGEQAVIGLPANAEGTHNNAANTMEDVDGNDIDGVTYLAYNKLKEIPWITTVNTDFVRQATIGTGNYCEVNFADTTHNNILGAMLAIQYASAGTGANNGKTYVLDSNNQSTTVYSGTMALAIASYKSAIVTLPSGGWTMAHVNALRARLGYSSDVIDIPYWEAMILEVAYAADIPITWIPKVIIIQ